MKKFSMLLVFFIFGCNSVDTKITTKQIDNIKKKFTKQEITYFYETVFFTDPQFKESKKFIENTKIYKWNKDVYIRAFGDLSKENLEKLQETVKYLNTLKLPIKIYITEKENYNVDIYFGNEQYITKNYKGYLPKSVVGIAMQFSKSDYFLDKGTIAINTKSSYDYVFYKSNVILEELTQTLGIPGDSYSYPNSTFYQGEKNYKYSKILSPVDVKILQLLYSKDIVAGLDKKEYLEAFADIIPSEMKLEDKDYEAFDNFIKHNKFSTHAVNLFYNTAFSDANSFIKEPHIQKWNTNINCYIHKDINKKDSLLVLSSLNYLSKNIPYLSYKINTNKDINTNLGFWYFNGNGEMEQIRLVDKDMFNYQIFQGIVSMLNENFYDPSNNLKKKLLLRQLLIVLGLNPISEKNEKSLSNILWKIDETNTLLSDTDKELLKIFFAKSLKVGMTKCKVVKILKKYYSIQQEN
jgi:hypothetical protein